MNRLALILAMFVSSGTDNSYAQEEQTVLTDTSVRAPTVSGTGLSIEAGQVASFRRLVSEALRTQLSYFTVEHIGTQSQWLLSWGTVSEINCDGFQVQSTTSNPYGWTVSWQMEGFVTGQGTTVVPQSYSWKGISLYGAFRLVQVDLDGTQTVYYPGTTGIAIEKAKVTKFAMEQNYPNPFNPSTQISISTTKEGLISLRVYDVLGREVATLVNETRKPGQYTERFDGSRLASGVYMYVLQSADGRLTNRMILSK